MRSENPLISVILPVRDAGAFLHDAVNSILSQDHSNIELIIVDDLATSTDRRTISRFVNTDARVFCIHNHGVGLTQALNSGLQHAKGAFIARMDADDFSESNRFSKQLAFFYKHPEVSILGSSVYYIDGAGVIQGSWTPPLQHLHIREAIHYYNPIVHPTVMFRWPLADLTTPYDDSQQYAQDLRLWLVLIEKGLVFGNLPDKLVRLRVHGSRVSVKQTWPQFRSMLKARGVALSAETGSLEFEVPPTFEASWIKLLRLRGVKPLLILNWFYPDWRSWSKVHAKYYFHALRYEALNRITLRLWAYVFLNIMHRRSSHFVSSFVRKI